MQTNLIKNVREKRGLSKYRLAEMIGVEWHTILKIERGSDFKVSTLLKIAAALDVSVADLIDDNKK